MLIKDTHSMKAEGYRPTKRTRTKTRFRRK